MSSSNGPYQGVRDNGRRGRFSRQAYRGRADRRTDSMSRSGERRDPPGGNERSQESTDEEWKRITDWVDTVPIAQYRAVFGSLDLATAQYYQKFIQDQQRAPAESQLAAAAVPALDKGSRAEIKRIDRRTHDMDRDVFKLVGDMKDLRVRVSAIERDLKHLSESSVNVVDKLSTISKDIGARFESLVRSTGQSLDALNDKVTALQSHTALQAAPPSPPYHLPSSPLYAPPDSPLYPLPPSPDASGVYDESSDEGADIQAREKEAALREHDVEVIEFDNDDDDDGDARLQMPTTPPQDTAVPATGPQETPVTSDETEILRDVQTTKPVAESSAAAPEPSSPLEDGQIPAEETQTPSPTPKAVALKHRLMKRRRLKELKLKANRKKTVTTKSGTATNSRGATGEGGIRKRKRSSVGDTTIESGVQTPAKKKKTRVE